MFLVLQLRIVPAWVSTCLIHILLGVLSSLELLKNPWGLSFVPKQGHPQVYPGLKEPLKLLLVDTGGHCWQPSRIVSRTMVGGDLRRLESGWREVFFPWPRLAGGEPHFLSLRLISQGSSSWCQIHPFCRGWLLQHIECPGACVHILHSLECLLSFPRGQEASLFHKDFIFPICPARAPDTTQPPTLHQFPTSTPLP